MNNRRDRLPNRRFSETYSFEHDGLRFHGSVGWAVNGTTAKPAEVFLDASKPGSAMQAMARDAAVLASLALQFGAPLETIRSALTRNDDDGPAGPLCKLLDMIDVEALPND